MEPATESVWLKPQLADEIMSSDLSDRIQSIIADIMTNRVDILHIVENMAGVLTNKEAENREKGMVFFTKLLKQLPKDYLNENQVKFISMFYVDRLKDNHRVIPAALDGYLAIIDMKNYNVQNSAQFFTALFREVPCQSQLTKDRYKIYLIIQKLMEKDVEYMKSLGPDFVYGVISAIDGERDPRNLMFLFSFLPSFIAQMPLGHLVEEMFEVIACYYPVDFHPPNDPAAVTRQDLANALCPCLCAFPGFGEQCLALLIEKLDSGHRIAKLDSLKLLTESCKTFNPESYAPFLRALWASIQREISHKTDSELRMESHKALSALVAKLSTTANTDQAFETFVEGILITMQTYIAEATTGAQLMLATRVLLTTANASKSSAIIIVGAMIPATIAFYNFKTSINLQIRSVEFLGDLYDIAKHWEILDVLQEQISTIPQQCLTAVSSLLKTFQIAGFRTLIRAIDTLKSDLVLPFVEILVHNIQVSEDSDLLSISVETIHALGRKHPELVMSLVVRGKCDLDNLMEDKQALRKRLNLLSNLASIDDFTKIIIEEMLKYVSAKDTEADKVVEALNRSMSNTSMYSLHKVAEIESDHGLIDSVLAWLYTEIENVPYDSVAHGYKLIAHTVSSLPAEKQKTVLSKHSPSILEKCKVNENYFYVLDSLYISVHHSVYDDLFLDVLSVSLELSLKSENEGVRNTACGLTAQFLNKAEYGPTFDVQYEMLTQYLSSCSRKSSDICPRLLHLYGWIVKALIMRGSDMYCFWLQKISIVLQVPEYCKHGAEAIRLIMSEPTDHLNPQQHCRVSLLYKQRMFDAFSKLSNKIQLKDETKESYLLSWAYVLAKAPKSVLNSEVEMIAPIVIDSLVISNKDLLLVMIDILCHFVQSGLPTLAGNLQTVLPRLVTLTQYNDSMEVRIKSLQCLYEIANSYSTALLLPHKQDLLINLAPSLDDKKRLVRNSAVKARTRWFLIGAPGEDKSN